ncbi:hypothetical protein ACP6C7_29125 [Mycolicibacterium septicum]|uniref:Transposase n=1 Tax=Mycolicibacterium septicum TaxID=98668 RepID=A0ABW9M263_9MYCO
MLRKQLCGILDLQRRMYAELAIATTNPAIGSAARTAMKSVLLTMKRVNDPQTNQQQRQPAQYALKRLVDIQIRFIEKMPVDWDEARRQRQIEAMRNVTIDLRRAILDESA